MKASETIHRTALSWSGVTAAPHRFGGNEYRLGKRELGHVHGDYLIDIPFPKPVRNELVAAGLAEPHHVLPESGWISFYIKNAEDVERAINLLRRSYDLAMQQESRRNAQASLKQERQP
jgi:Luciferase